MRFLPVLVVVYVLAPAAPSVAQTAVETEWPHLELSVGAQGMSNGPGTDIERQMRALGFSDPDENGHEAPFTHAAGQLIPGVFAAVHVAVARHMTIGLLIGAVENETDGFRVATTERALTSVVAYERVNTAGLVVSYRANRWFRIGAGPALHDRLLYFDGSTQRNLSAEAAGVGWIASAEGKFTRPRIEPGRAPVFGYVTAQYRRVPAFATGPSVVRILGTDRSSLRWPATTVHYDHWAIGVGVGLEF